MKMKIDFVIEEIDHDYYCIPLNTENFKKKGIFKVNDTGKYILECLNQDIAYDSLVDKVKSEFDCDTDEAKESIDIILNGLRLFNLLEE